MSETRLEARLEPPVTPGREIQFDDLTRLCDRLKECLRATESALTDEAPHAKYQLVELELASVDIALKPLRGSRLEDIAASTIRLFTSTVAALQFDGIVDPRINRAALQSYRKFADTFLKRDSTVRIGGVSLTTRFVSNIDDLLGRYFVSEGTVKGRIERLNIHHDKNVCALFSPIHDRGIECSFDSEVFPQVHAAVGKNATVLGKLKFSGRSALPEHIYITSVEVHPDDDDLPTLGSLRGLLGPDALGGMSTEDFLASVRNGSD
jgi:hypothetical protein